jgi:CTP-dependent riboflavin kinase
VTIEPICSRCIAIVKALEPSLQEAIAALKSLRDNYYVSRLLVEEVDEGEWIHEVKDGEKVLLKKWRGKNEYKSEYLGSILSGFSFYLSYESIRQFDFLCCN